MKKTLIIYLSLIGLFAIPFKSFAEARHLNIAMVDTMLIQQYLISVVDKSIEGDFKSRYEKLNSLGQEITEKEAKFNKEKSIISVAAKKTEEAKIEALKQRYNEDARKFEEELNQKRNDLMKPKFEAVIEAVKELSRKENYDMVLTKGAALYADNKYDITDEVLKIYEAKNK